jgi:hypothetical protein
MHHRLVHRPARDVTRTSLISGRLLVAATMLLGTIMLGLQGASAQADERAGTYESPTFGYTLEWDADLWKVESDTEADSNYPRDLLGLSDVDGTTILFVEASEADWSSTDDCVAGLFEDIGLDPADGTVIEDADGKAFEVSDADRSLAAYVFPIDLTSGETQDQVRLVECRADPDSDLIVGFTAYSGILDQYPEQGYPLVAAVADSLTFAAGDNGGATPQASRRGNATPVASDAGTPVTGNGTPSAGSGDGDYTSPTFGYTLTFSPNDWSVDDEASADDNPAKRDRLDLSNDDGSSLLFVEGSDEWTNADDCVSTLVDEVGVDPATANTVDDPDTGDPYEISEDDHAAVAYTVSDSGGGFTALIDCRQDPDSGVVVGVTNLTSEVDDYFGQVYPPVEDVLNSLEF